MPLRYPYYHAVQEALDVLLTALAPFLEHELRRKCPREWRQKITARAFPNTSVEQALNDVRVVLKVVDAEWDVFKEKLGPHRELVRFIKSRVGDMPRHGRPVEITRDRASAYLLQIEELLDLLGAQREVAIIRRNRAEVEQLDRTNERPHVEKVAPHTTDRAAELWSAFRVGRQLQMVSAAGTDVHIMSFGPDGDQSQRWPIRAPVRGLALTDDGRALAVLTKDCLVMAWLTPEGRLLEWPRRFAIPIANCELIAARTVGRRVELLLRDGSSSHRIPVGPGGGPPQVADVGRSLQAGAARDDGFVTIDRDGQLNLDPSEAFHFDHPLASEWISIDAATGGGVTLVAAVGTHGDAYSLYVSRNGPDGSFSRTMALDAPCQRVVAARVAAPYSQPMDVIAQVDVQLRAWSWTDLLALS